MNSNDLSTIVGLIAYVGSPAFVLFITSNILEHVPYFTALSALSKKLWMTVIGIALALASHALLQSVDPAVWTQIQSVYAVIFAAVLAIWSADQQHERFENRQVKRAVRAAAIKSANAGTVDFAIAAKLPKNAVG